MPTSAGISPPARSDRGANVLQPCPRDTMNDRRRFVALTGGQLFAATNSLVKGKRRLILHRYLRISGNSQLSQACLGVVLISSSAENSRQRKVTREQSTTMCTSGGVWVSFRVLPTQGETRLILPRDIPGCIGGKSAVTRRKLLFLAPFVPAIVGACGPFSSDDSETEESLGTSVTVYARHGSYAAHARCLWRPD